MARVHRVGMPENESEALAVKTLAERLPDDYAVVTDFEIWHVEVKGYRGSIRGDAPLERSFSASSSSPSTQARVTYLIAA